jgi:hypothetical protein
MMEPFGRRAAGTLLLCAGLTACTGDVRNDIDSINSELTGPYQVVSTSDAKTFVAKVCAPAGSRDELIAKQIVHQRLNHGHDTIVVNVYKAGGGAGTQFVWTPDAGLRAGPAPDGRPAECP